MTNCVFSLEFGTDNDAFTEDPASEIARILRKVAASVENGHDEGKILDINGNRVGHWEHEYDTETEEEGEE